MADLDIQETNRLRASLGMKLLPVPSGQPSRQSAPSQGDSGSSGSESGSEEEEDDDPGSTLEKRQQQGYDNWRALQEEAEAKRNRQAKAEAVRKARDAAQRFARLKGKGLGDVDDQESKESDVDARTWLLQQKKRRKGIEQERAKALRLEQELVERERDATNYTEKDLAGLNVAHTIDEFDGTGEQILTLKDATIDENEEEGDELENAALRDQERLKERLNSKKRKIRYDPNELGDGQPSSILQHYDETIEGKRKSNFQLGGKISNEQRQVLKDTVGKKMQNQAISLDLPMETPSASDYLEAMPVKMKKPKKSKTKSRRRKAYEDDDDDVAEPNQSKDQMDTDAVQIETQQEKTDIDNSTSFVDDDDLQAGLALQRAAALKKRRKIRPEDIARQLREDATADTAGSDDQQDAGLIIDETTEFVASLQRSKDQAQEQRDRGEDGLQSPSKFKEDSKAKEEDQDVNMNDIPDVLASFAKEEEPRQTTTPPPHEVSTTGLEEETTLETGLGATMSMLSQRGLIAPRREEDIVGLHRERQRFLFEKQKREADIERRARLQRERDRASGKLDHMSAREREEYARQENKQRDHYESRVITDVFNREYKPDVQLKYVDEHGRSMNQKEAFKHLSHQFHGKGSGKQKTEKHLRKIEDEKAAESKSLLDVTRDRGMTNAQGATARKNRQAGVRLG